MLKRILILSAILIVVITITYWVSSIYSVKFLQSKIREMLGPEISISQIYATTRYVAGKGILFQDPLSKLKLLEVDEIQIYPAFRSIFYTRRIVIKKVVLYQPSFLIIRTRDSVVILPGSTTRRPPPKKKEKSSTKIIIDDIFIKNGKFVFIDHKKHSPPAVIRLYELETNIGNIRHPFVSEKRSPISLKGKLSAEKGGTINLNGWIAFTNFDMYLKTSVVNALLKPFEPYYKKSLGDLILGGYFTLSAGIEIRNHIIDASGNLRLFKLRINEKSTKKIIISSKTITKILKNQNNQIKTKFHARGNLKNPKFSLSKSILTSIIGNISKSSGISLGKKTGNFFKEKSKKGVDAIKRLFKRKK